MLRWATRRGAFTSTGRSFTSTARLPRPKIRACVFDKDGTLLDAERTWVAAFRAACRAMPEDDEKLFSVLGFDGASGRFSPSMGFMVDTNPTLAEMLRGHGIDSELFYETLAAQPLRNVPLVNTGLLFDSMRAAGLHVGVLTSDDRTNARQFLEEEGVTADAMVCGDDGRGHKPNADPLLAVAADIGVLPSEVILVGDSLHDVHCVKAAGAVAVGVLTGVAGKTELAGPADVVLGSVLEIDAAFLERFGVGGE